MSNIAWSKIHARRNNITNPGDYFWLLGIKIHRINSIILHKSNLNLNLYHHMNGISRLNTYKERYKQKSLKNKNPTIYDCQG